MLFLNFQIDGFQVPSMTIWVLAWVFLVIGFFSLAILIIYTKYGRELSIRLSIISIIISAILLGFAFHFFLITFGI
ncbi:MAG: hypothetical protein EAX91_04875 [Candidatus Lokiarchaeota archaeon]|nr:hypothetical protein [Candidatus Lokiarchaeota archaeon]